MRTGARLLHALMLSLPLLAHAGGRPQDYASGWPLEITSPAPAQRVQLSPELYAHSVDAALGDVAAFNAAGEPVPFGPLSPPPARAAVEVDVAWFALPDADARAAIDEGVRLRIERDGDGRVRSVDAALADPGAATVRAASLLIDLHEHAGRTQWIALHWLREGDVSARYRIAASDDLVRWRFVREAGVLDLRQGGFTLQRNRIDLPDLRSRYLLLTRVDGRVPTPSRVAAGVREAEAGIESAVDWHWQAVSLQPADAPGDYRATSPGPLPVARLMLRLATANSVADVRIDSRDDDAAPWRERARFTAFHLGDATHAMESEPQALPQVVRDRQWRVRATPALDRPPQLELGYGAEQFVLLTRGDGPFIVAAGSAHARRGDYPLAPALSELAARHGDGWRPPLATLGERRELGGTAALVVARPVDWKAWVLWLVLVTGAALVLWMVARLLREGRAGR